MYANHACRARGRSLPRGLSSTPSSPQHKKPSVQQDDVTPSGRAWKDVRPKTPENARQNTTCVRCMSHDQNITPSRIDAPIHVREQRDRQGKGLYLHRRESLARLIFIPPTDTQVVRDLFSTASTPNWVEIESRYALNIRHTPRLDRKSVV